MGGADPSSDRSIASGVVGHGRAKPRGILTGGAEAVPADATGHGGVEVSASVDGPRVAIEPVTAAAAPIVIGETAKDLGAAVAVRLVRALGGEVALEDERLVVTLPV